VPLEISKLQLKDKAGDDEEQAEVKESEGEEKPKLLPVSYFQVCTSACVWQRPTCLHLPSHCDPL